MKILLVNPPFNHIIYPNLRKQLAYEMPLGLLYVASFVRNEDISILDANALVYQIDEVAKKIICRNPDLVGFTATTLTMPIVCKIIKGIREVDNKIKIVVGGVHASFTAQQTLNDNPGIDFVVIGEGEETFNEFIGTIKKNGALNKVRGLAFRDKGSIIINEPRPLLADLDTIPFPARELLPNNIYNPTPFFNLGFKGEQYATVITSRGCPSRCTFCSARNFWKTFRMRSAENIIEELAYLIKGGVRHICFLDSTLTADQKRLFKICDHIIKEGWDIKWHCYSRVNSVNDETLKKMKKAGCFCILYGLESGNQEILNGVKKDTTLEMARQAVYLTKKNNIITDCSFIFGLPGETKESMEETLRFAMQLNPHLAKFYYATPFPGTEMFNEAINNGWLKKEVKWDDFNYVKDYLMILPKIDMYEVDKKVKQAYRRFYIRIGYFTQALCSIFLNPYFLKIYYQGIIILFSQFVKRNK